ncbi:cobalamin-binding protein [Mastigocoleus testarum]|uniref:ABC transporter substrate-binding protein n=1 Tax=Mastigocoleus testarum BC008 TaxID=371196 RepID=A0A0V7ZLF2_9CYAN|nr:cobalamin-binding protein [Mastigocoleus testarum]KST65472.1 ABC transporter substrate-binding protein [Mastigocoleus testarum BC008]
MEDSNFRIISLIPSATEILAALGLTSKIVGRSHECDYPPEIIDRPICTSARLNTDASSSEIHSDVNNLLRSALSIYEVKTDVIKKLKPTHIVTQDQCDVCAVSLSEVEKVLTQLAQNSVEVISLQPKVLKDVWTDIERVGSVFDVDSRQLLENLEARVKIVANKTQGISPSKLLPTVACIEWTDPLMIAANWIPELVTIAGGKPLFAKTGKSSGKINWENILETNPDVIVFMPCGFDLNRTHKEAELLTKMPTWKELHAVKSGRVYITDGNSYFNRPGPRLVESLEILAEIIHPEVFQYGYKNQAWKEF